MFLKKGNSTHAIFSTAKMNFNSDFLKDKICNDEQIALITALLNNTDSCLEAGRNTTKHLISA